MSQIARMIAGPPGVSRGVSSLALALALLAAGAAWVPAAPARAADAGVPESQPLVVLLRDQVASTRPGVLAPRVATVARRRPLTHLRTVLPVLGRSTSGGRTWVRVRLPGRPNGHSGWIRTTHTMSTATEWRIAVRLAARRLTVYRDGHIVRRFSVVVGHPSTPTPRGFFFVEEAVALAPGDAGGPFALATSARSEVLQEFDGGPGQIALHGTNNLSGQLGTAASHGCVRLSPAAITWLVRRVGRGVPLVITR